MKGGYEGTGGTGLEKGWGKERGRGGKGGREYEKEGEAVWKPGRRLVYYVWTKLKYLAIVFVLVEEMQCESVCHDCVGDHQILFY